MEIDDLVDEAQVIVIGAGPSGLMSAKVAQEYGYKVLLIDSGHNAGVKYSSILDRNKLRFTSGGLGGAAKNWGAQCALPSLQNLNQWTNLIGANRTYIPQIYESVKNVSEFLNLKISIDNNYFKNEIEHYSEMFSTKHSVYLPQSDLTEYFSDLISSSTYIENISVARLFSNEKNIELIQIGNKKINVKGKFIILACGTIATTEIVNASLQSGETLTYSLQDHPHGYLVTFRGTQPTKLSKKQVRKFRGINYKRKFEFSSRNYSRSAVIEFHYDISGKVWKSLNLPLLDYSQVKLRTLINRVIYKFSGQFLFPVPYTHVWVQIEQDKVPYLKCKNGVAESSWELGDSDIDFLREIQEKVLDLGTSLGLELVWALDLENKGDVQSLFVDAFHPSGTLTSHRLSDCGFVNEYGKVHGLENLIINSAATWPVSGWFNPTFFLMCIADLNTRNLLNEVEISSSCGDSLI